MIILISFRSSGMELNVNVLCVMLQGKVSLFCKGCNSLYLSCLRLKVCVKSVSRTRPSNAVVHGI